MNNLSPELLAQLYCQNSDDPFIALVTLSHPSFTTLRLVNNTVNVVSRGNTFLSFPLRFRLPVDDGESAREVHMEFDNVGLDLIDEIRTVTTPIDVTIELVLASLPNVVQVELGELKISNISYNSKSITAKLYLDGFMNVEMTSEKYSPSLYPGLF
jgi:hypothetical protein